MTGRVFNAGWPRVGITQRVVNATYEERRDALDQRWAQFLYSCHVSPIPLPNCHPDLKRHVQTLKLQGLILSGGEDIGNVPERSIPAESALTCSSGAAPERDEAEGLLVQESIRHGWPVIGVCRGMQFLNVFHGGRLCGLHGHVGNPHGIDWVAADRRLRDLRFDDEVNSYHRFGIQMGDLGEGLVPLARTSGWVEAFAHVRHSHYGIMWHPERNNVFSRNDIAFFQAVLHDMDLSA